MPGSTRCTSPAGPLPTRGGTGSGARPFPQGNSPGEESGEQQGRRERVQPRAESQEVGSTRTSSHLVAEGREVPLKALVLALQGLDTGQVVAIIVCV